MRAKVLSAREIQKKRFAVQKQKNKVEKAFQTLGRCYYDGQRGDDSSNELLADYAKRRGSCVIVKGLRAGSDFENEFQMALINHKINPELDTMFLTAESQYMYLSSSTVKELGRYGVDLSDFLPQEIIPDFKKRISNQ